MNAFGLDFLIMWGVWIIIPLAADISQALWDSFLVWRNGRLAKLFPPLMQTPLPKISIIIPAHNEQLNIDRCITSLKAQTYPHERIEILIVNDGSTDRTEEVVNGHIHGTPHWNGHIRLYNRVIPAHEFGGVMMLLRGEHTGKPAAVNLGLRHARGDLIFTVDSDAVLEPEALQQAVIAFQRRPDLAAATAHLIIDRDLLVENDGNGHIHLDSDDLPLPKRLSWMERFLSTAQFIEYFQSFRIGRHAEAIRDELFTLSGACAIYRRDALHAIRGYRGRTVSEDTDATLTLQRFPGKVTYLPQVRIHLAPTESWKALYSQRVRWQRGELEALAVHYDMLGSRKRLWRIGLPRRLQRDHTMAFLRLVWAFLLPMFPLLGYSVAMVAQAMALIYGMYILADGVQIAAAWSICAPSERRILRQSIVYLPLLPLYRMAVYFFRMSGNLKTLTEPPRWTASAGWIDKLRLPGGGKFAGWLRTLTEFWAG
ncbi:MAG: glycosyltransferase [Anaerolineales bacterium]|nr:glycosyltransferase [Anaerolineales bacterium]